MCRSPCAEAASRGPPRVEPEAERPAAQWAHRPAATEARKQRPPARWRRGRVTSAVYREPDHSGRGYSCEVTDVLGGSGSAGLPTPGGRNWPRRERPEAQEGTTTAEARRPGHTKTEGPKAKTPARRSDAWSGRARRRKAAARAPGKTQGYERVPARPAEAGSGTDFGRRQARPRGSGPGPAARARRTSPRDGVPGDLRAPGSHRGRTRGRRRPGPAASAAQPSLPF